MQQGKHTSCNGGQSAGLPKARVPAPVGGGGQNDATATDDDGKHIEMGDNNNNNKTTPKRRRQQRIGHWTMTMTKEMIKIK